MTTGTFRQTPITSITVAPDRQRKEFRGMEELRSSIQSIGLINPILITPEGVLVAGERRLRACTELGWTHIPAQLTSDLAEDELQLVELEENVKRVDLSWQEQVAAIQRYHNLRREADPEWTIASTAAALSIAQNTASKYLAVAAGIEADPKLAEAPAFSVAHGIVERASARKQGFEEAKIAAFVAPSPVLGEAPLPAEERASVEATPSPAPSVPFLNADFLTWTPPHKFNLLHCDFPYGVKADKHNQGAAASFGGYDDGFDVYDRLLTHLHTFTQEWMLPSSHLLFWFSMDFYQMTVDRLTAAGWRVNPFPLVWFKSDNSGILPDPRRGPRRNYETALLCSLGDRPIVRATGNLCAHPNTKSIHMSEKPQGMLTHFLSMLVDSSTIMLDPTMGSGNAVVVAERLGAHSALGLERDPEFFARARDAYLSGQVGEE